MTERTSGETPLVIRAQNWTARETAYRMPTVFKTMALHYDPTPGGRRNDDGTTSYSLVFPALLLTDIVSDQENVAQKIADELNAFPALVKALEECAAAFKTPPGSVAQCQQAIAVEFQRRIDLAAAALAATGGQITSNADQPGT